MAIVSRLGVVLGLDSAEFNKGLGLAESKLGGFAKSSMASSLSLATLGASMAGAAIFAINYADKINDTAQANEMTIGSVLKLSEALSISGGSSENAGKLLAGLTNKIDEAAGGSDKSRESFAKLGISLKDLGTLDETQLFEKSLAGLNAIPDVVTRNALAMELFGKAAKNVNIKGVADSYFNNAKNFDDAEKAFKDIGDAVDMLDKFTHQAAVTLAQDLGPALKASLVWVDKAVFGWDKLSDAISKASKKAQENAKWKPAAKIGTDISASEVMGITGSLPKIRETPLSVKEEAALEKANAKKIADAKKLADEIKKQKDALQDQIQAFDAQSYAAGRTLTEVEKITLELEQGKKYKYASKTEKEDLLNAAKRLDYNNAYADASKRANDFALQSYELSKKANDLVSDSTTATERLNVEKLLIGSSDTQLQLGLEYFDLQKKILAMKKEGYAEEDIANYANAEMIRIKTQEETTRAQKTFQAGWETAYSNFVEKAKDSSSLGAQAFTSMADSMNSALDNFVSTGKLSFSDLASSIIKDLIKIQLKAQATSLFSSLLGGMGFGGGGFPSLDTSAVDAGGVLSGGILGFADGGSPPVNQVSMVGERGAELFVPRSAGTIIPNNALSSLGGNNQPQTVYNGTVIQNMSAIDTQSGIQFLSKNKNTIWAVNQSAQRSLPQSR